MAPDSNLQKPLINVNISDVTKLSSINYLAWSNQIKALLGRYDLMEFIEESTTPPPATITIDGTTAPNPALTLWQAQDCLIHSALINATETPHQVLIIATASTSLEAWKTLASTYGNQSTRSVDEYMKTKADAISRKKEEQETLHLQAQALERKHQKELRLRKETEYALAIEQERIGKLKLQLQILKKKHGIMRLKAEEFESKYIDEMILRKETEIDLDKERKELEEMKQLQDNLSSQVSTWQNKYEEELSLRKEKEEALSREKEELDIAQVLLKTYNKETDVMREERDNALKILEEITTKQLEERQPPDYFICPITQEVMEDPQIAADGFTYEAEAIKEWLSTGHETSPMTNVKLPHHTLVPNRSLRSAIQEFV